MRYGSIEVPWTVLWSSEEAARAEIRPCPYASGLPALCTPESPGIGKPVFGKTHDVRQRRAVAQSLCDICGKPLAGRTKVSLSKGRVCTVDGRLTVLVVEPLCHKECAALSLRQCPHLKREIGQGILWVRQVTRWNVAGQQLTGAATMEFAGVSAPGTIGHLKLSITQWRDRDAAWLEAA